MILKGSQRASANQLAMHLMNDVDNDHVTVHELRGFIADDLEGAFNEAYAVSRGTKCKQFLFSLSLSPPETENVGIETFELAIRDIEDKLGLAEQPRAIIFHEKEGRRHAHCVWSRIDVDEMKAINLSHFKYKLRDKSRELYLENQWQMPKGLVNSEARDPLNFTLAEWQQAKRHGVDGKKVKEAIQDAWAISDSVSAFRAALQERGFRLAQGDSRGHVVVDIDGNIYALSRAVGIKAKDVRARLGGADDLSKVSRVQEEIAADISNKLAGFIDVQSYKLKKAQCEFKAERRRLVEVQRAVRQNLLHQQEMRRIAETKTRASRLPRGLKALWFRITGAYQKIKRENEFALEVIANVHRTELHSLVQQQLGNRRKMCRKHSENRSRLHDQLRSLVGEVDAYQVNVNLHNSNNSRSIKRSKKR